MAGQLRPALRVAGPPGRGHRPGAMSAIRAPSCRPSTSCAAASASSATGRRPRHARTTPPSCASSTASTGSVRCAAARSANWSAPASWTAPTRSARDPAASRLSGGLPQPGGPARPHPRVAARGPARADPRQRRQQGAAEIGLRVGQVRNRYKVAKHFVCDIGDERFDYRRDVARIDSEPSTATSSAPRCPPRTSRQDSSRPSRGSSGPFARSTICRCGRSATAWPSACAPTFSCACWRTTWSGTCARRGARCCSPTRNWPPRRARAIRRSGRTLRQRQAEEGHPPDRGRDSAAQLPHAAGGSGGGDAQLLRTKGPAGSRRYDGDAS